MIKEGWVNNVSYLQKFINTVKVVVKYDENEKVNLIREIISVRLHMQLYIRV